MRVGCTRVTASSNGRGLTKSPRPPHLYTLISSMLSAQDESFDAINGRWAPVIQRPPPDRCVCLCLCCLSADCVVVVRLSDRASSALQSLNQDRCTSLPSRVVPSFELSYYRQRRGPTQPNFYFSQNREREREMPVVYSNTASASISLFRLWPFLSSLNTSTGSIPSRSSSHLGICCCVISLVV